MIAIMVIFAISMLVSCDKTKNPDINDSNISNESNDCEDIAITFNTNCDNEIEDFFLKKDENGDVELPENPSKEGYEFVGWFLDREFENELNIKELNSNVNVYAKWNKIDEPIEKANIIDLINNNPNFWKARPNLNYINLIYYKDCYLNLSDYTQEIIGDGLFLGTTPILYSCPSELIKYIDLSHYEVDKKTQLIKNIKFNWLTEAFIKGIEERTDNNGKNYYVYKGTNILFGTGTEKLIGEYTVPKEITTIGEYAFGENYVTNYKYIDESISNRIILADGLTSVKLPYGLKNIGENAFRGCASLSNINLPENIESIEKGAFVDCDSLDYVIIPNNISYINNAFNDNTIIFYEGTKEKLSTLANIKWEYAHCNFKGTLNKCNYKSLQFITIDNGNNHKAILSSIIGDINVLDIPNIITNNGISYDVNYVAYSAFYGKNIVGIKMPNSLETLEYEYSWSKSIYICYEGTEEEFRNINSKEIYSYDETKINYNFTGTLCGYTFEDIIYVLLNDGINQTAILLKCNNCTNILEIPDKVNYEGMEYTVNEINSINNSYLKCIKMPNSIIKLKKNILYQFNYIFYEGTQEQYDAIENINNNICKLSPKFYNFTGTITSSVVESIEYILVNNENSHDAFVIQDFRNNDWCWAINIPNIVINEGIEYEVTQISNYYNSYSDLSSIKIPASITKIGINAFKNYRNIDSIYYEGTQEQWEAITNNDLLKSSKIIFNFTGSYKLYMDDVYKYLLIEDGETYEATICAVNNFTESMTVPNKISNEGKEYSIKRIANNAFSKEIIYYIDHLDHNIYLKSIIIEDGITEIGDYAFSNCIELVNIEIPESILSISSLAFNECDNIAYNIKDNIKYLGCDSNLYVIAMGTTNNFNSLNQIDEHCKIINNYAFCGCKSLENLVIPNGVISIGNEAFSLCNKLKNVTIPESVKSIGEKAFYNCYLLETLVLLNDIKDIGDHAFSCDCNNPNIVCIGECEYTGGNLTDVYLGDNFETIGNWMYNIGKLKNIIVSQNNLLYKSIDGILFSKDGTQLVLYPSGKEATSYEIPISVTSISNNAFNNNNYLTNIVIPDSVISLGDSVFRHCRNITNIVIGNGIKNINSYVFENCINLSSLSIGDNVETIELSAFYDCSQLSNIEVSSNNQYFKSIDGVLYIIDGVRLFDSNSPGHYINN